MAFVEEKDYGTLIDKQALAVFQQTKRTGNAPKAWHGKN